MKAGLKKGLQLLVIAGLSVSVAACSSGSKAAVDTSLSIGDIQKKAQSEGQVVSVGMPDTWANWKDTWNDLNTKYQIAHTDTDMSSAEEIAKFETETKKPTADIGDIGISFGPVAADKGVTLPYKTQYWNDIPDWAKDTDGNWVGEYTGTIAFITNTKLVPNPPKSWSDLLNGNYQIATGDVTKASQAQMGVLAAAIAHGGDEGNIQPGIDFFAQLAKQKRLSSVDTTPANFEKGEIPVGIVWDFNGLNYRQQLDPNVYQVTIPQDGTVISAYVSIINKNAPHPYAAMLARDYILSDAGQINLAKGYARPIRSNVTLPADVAAKMLPASEYTSAKPISDYKKWEDTSKQLPQLWQEQVLVNMS